MHDQTALAPLRPLLSTRTWNLLDRNGYTSIDQIREALQNGLRPGDIRGMGPAALLEIRLALDGLPVHPNPGSGSVADDTPIISGTVISSKDPRDGVLPFVRIRDALDIARLCARTEPGDWVIDQMIRALTGAGQEGATPEYLEFLESMEDAPVHPDPNLIGASSVHRDPVDKPPLWAAAAEAYQRGKLTVLPRSTTVRDPSVYEQNLPYQDNDNDFAGYEMD